MVQVGLCKKISTQHYVKHSKVKGDIIVHALPPKDETVGCSKF